MRRVSRDGRRRWSQPGTLCQVEALREGRHPGHHLLYEYHANQAGREDQVIPGEGGRWRVAGGGWEVEGGRWRAVAGVDALPGPLATLPRPP